MRPALIIVALMLAWPAAAHAGTVTGALTYTGVPSGEDVTVSTVTGSQIAFNSQAGVTGCAAQDPDTVWCPFAATVTVTMGPADDHIDATGLSNAALVASGGDGSDYLYGGSQGSTLDGGPGEDYLTDGPGNDVVTGGPGNDTFHAGLGADRYIGGDGNDTVDYSARLNPVTITLNGGADDGEAGEGDDVGTEMEEALGGNGDDHIVGNDLGDTLIGGPGNDTIVGGKAEDRIEGDEGDDTIDARDGHYDSIDCGPGFDVVYADPGDGTTNCEVAPDPDGDGYLAPADCAPNDPSIHPGAPEIYGNAVDENCDGIVGYLRVSALIGYAQNVDKHRSRVRFTRLVVQEVQPGDTLQLRCSGKGCPFKTRTQTGRAGHPTVNLVSLLKKRYLSKGAKLEVRVLRANQIGVVRRITVGRKGKLSVQNLCMSPGATAPSTCTQ